jgi:hypothetical protein
MSDHSASSTANAASTVGLDFERAIPSSARAPLAESAEAGNPAAPAAPVAQQSVSCSACNRSMTTTYHTVNGAPVCGACRLKAQSAGGSVSDPATLAKAMLFGLGAAIVGAAVYWAVMYYADSEIAIVAIFTGWMVGSAMTKATEGRGGRLLQVGAVLLVYVSVAMAYFAFLMSKALTESGAAASELGINAGTVMISAALGLAMPIISIIGSMPGGLISALIIGFGMSQAWKMLVPTPIHVEGPFKVSGASV